jgi:uncharacterized BrkB/YihY/UPF0761 family membrane protein
MQCPNCGLFNPPGGQRCDCGYDFPTGGVTEPFTGSPGPYWNRTDPGQRQERRAFLVVPFVAIGVWYLLTLVHLAIINGRLRARTDLLAMAIGAVTVGLVVAILVTLLLAFPLYRLVRRLSVVRLRTALSGGAAIGALLTAVSLILDGETRSLLFGPDIAVLGGVVSAAVWWHVAGRPGPPRVDSHPL